MSSWEIMEISHDDNPETKIREKMYYPGEAPEGYRLSYRVFDEVPFRRDLAKSDCPTLEAARAAKRLLEVPLPAEGEDA